MNKNKGILIVLGIIIIALTLLLFLRLSKTYLVTFLTEGGTMYPSVDVHLNDKVTKPNNPVMVGYIFEKWVDADTGEEFDFNLPITKDTSIRAIYKSIVELEE